MFSLVNDEYVEVNDSVRFICGKLGVSPEFTYEGGERGWIGDNPFIYLDTKKVRNLGWTPKASIEEGVIKTVEYLMANPDAIAITFFKLPPSSTPITSLFSIIVFIKLVLIIVA